MFCGKARLSKKLRQRNFQVLSVDHKIHRGTTVLRIDISKRSDRKILEDILSMDCVLYCHFAPPCGTASAARRIGISNLDIPGPPPDGFVALTVRAEKEALIFIKVST